MITDNSRYLQRNPFLWFILIVVTTCCSSSRNESLRSYTDQEVWNRKLPFTLELSKAGKHLLYFGSLHSNSPENPMFSQLEQVLTDFAPEFVLHEGSSFWPRFSTRDSIIRFTGEIGLVRDFCKARNIPFSNLEPPERDEYKHLIKLFDRRDVYLMYFLREAEQLQRKLATGNAPVDPPEFERHVQSFINRLVVNGMPLKEKERNLTFILDYYETFFHEEFNIVTFNPKTIWPIYDISPLSQISRESSYFRDRFAINEIRNALAKHNRVFVIMGGSHLAVQEPSLRKLFD